MNVKDPISTSATKKQRVLTLLAHITALVRMDLLVTAHSVKVRFIALSFTKQ